MAASFVAPDTCVFRVLFWTVAKMHDMMNKHSEQLNVMHFQQIAKF